MVPALGQHRHVDHDADVPRRVVSEDLAGLSDQIAVDQRGGNASCPERVGDVFGVRDGGAEHHSLPVARLFP